MIEGKDKLYDLRLLKDMSGGEEEFEKEMIQYFVSNAPLVVDKMLELNEKKDWVGLRHVSHKFLSNVNMMGIEIVIKEVDLIEDYSMHQENLDELPPLLNHVKRYCLLAIEQLKEDIK